MMNTDLAIVRYNLQCGCFHSALKHAAEVLQSERTMQEASNTAEIKFWQAVATGMCGDLQKSVLELKTMIKHYPFIEYCLHSALTYFHNNNKGQMKYIQVQRVGIHEFEPVDDEGIILAAEFHLFITENYQEVARCLHFLSTIDLSRNTRQERQQILQTWYKLQSSSTSLISNGSVCNLEKNTTKESSNCNVEKLMVLARYHDKCGDKIKALECLNTVIAIYGSSFFPAYIERSQLHLSLGNFSSSEESAHIALQIQKDHIEAFKILTLNQYLSKYKNTLCFTSFYRLVNMYREQGMPPKSKKWLDTAKLFSRICAGHDEKTLNLALDMLVQSLQEAESNDTNHVVLLLEHARILRCLGRHKEALLQYEHASKIGKGNAYALQGIILCQMLSENVEDADDQIEFLSLLVQDDGKSIALDLTFAKLLRLRKYETNPMGGYAAVLKNACNIISSSGLDEYLFKIKKNKMDIYSDFDLNLCLNTLNDIICIVDFSHMHATNTDKNDFIWLVDEMKKVLQEIIKRYPSNVEALALLAKLCLELNDKDGLEGITSSSRSSMQNCPESSLIMVIKAQTQIRSNSISHSINILEDARAKNFSIQQHPLYCLTKGSAMFYQGKFRDADEQFNNFFTIMSKERHGLEMIRLVTTSDKRSILKLKCESLKKLNQENKIIDLVALIDSGYVGWYGFDIIKLKSDILLSAGDIDGAIHALNEVPPKEINGYDLAQSAVAQLQLNHKHDKKEYIQCYLNLVKIRGTPTSYFNLGVAYAQINCLEDTKHAFSYALEMDPRNEELVVKIGDFYTDTSQIDNALNVFISYDKQAPDNLKIKIKLANLYCMKGQPDLAKINLEMVQNLSDNEDANHTKQLYFFLKLAEIYCSINDWEMSAENLVKGLKIQRKIIDAKNERSLNDTNDKGKETAAEIAFDLSLCYYYQHQLRKAIEYIQCALELGTTTNQKYSRTLANLLYKNLQFEECLEICNKHHKEKNIDILILVTKSLIALSRYDTAFIKSSTFVVNNIHNFLYHSNRDFWIMISMHIYLLHILGEKCKIEDLCKQLDEGRNQMNYGLVFCKGLCYRLVHQPIKALHAFNIARKSHDWSYRATLNMIEVYLHIDDVLHLIFLTKAAKITNQQILRSANTLLDFVETRTDLANSVVVQLLKGYWEMQYSVICGTPQNRNNRFSDIIKVEKSNVGALLGMAISHKLAGSDVKAHNILKKIISMPLNFKFNREINYSYILLANDYLLRGSSEIAHEYCTHALSKNKSLFYAWQLKGKILEQRCSKLNEILECYEQCWHLKSDSSCAAGYGVATLCLQVNNVSKALEFISKIQKLAPENPHVKALVIKCASLLKV